MSEAKLYPSPFASGAFDEESSMCQWFYRHMDAMTAENLRSKADIAWQLAKRDADNDRLRAVIAETASELREHERAWRAGAEREGDKKKELVANRYRMFAAQLEEELKET